MDRHPRRPELNDAMALALAGARSVRVRGWLAEECEAAALERVARQWSRLGRNPSTAYAVGRSAALDELRRLTGWRRRTRFDLVPVAPEDLDQPTTEAGYEVVEAADLLERKLRRLRPRDRTITLRLVSGATGREVADSLGISPSIVSLALRRIAARFGR